MITYKHWRYIYRLGYHINRILISIWRHLNRILETVYDFLRFICLRKGFRSNGKQSVGVDDKDGKSRRLHKTLSGASKEFLSGMQYENIFFTEINEKFFEFKIDYIRFFF